MIKWCKEKKRKTLDSLVPAVLHINEFNYNQWCVGKIKNICSSDNDRFKCWILLHFVPFILRKKASPQFIAGCVDCTTHWYIWLKHHLCMAYEYFAIKIGAFRWLIEIDWIARKTSNAKKIDRKTSNALDLYANWKKAIELNLMKKWYGQNDLVTYSFRDSFHNPSLWRKVWMSLIFVKMTLDRSFVTIFRKFTAPSGFGKCKEIFAVVSMS